MTRIKIVTDSSVQLSPAELAQFDIKIVPLSVMIDGTVYFDGETIQRSEFMDKMAQAKALPKTSQPPLGSFVDVYDQLASEDTEIISIHMTEHLSGTVHAAHQAAQLTHANVTVIDSKFADRGLAFQVIAAAKMAAAGENKEAILNKIADICDHTRLFLAVDNLDNLVAGGRLSKVAGAIGGFLNIKVIIELIDGAITINSKGRGTKTLKKFYSQLYDDMENYGKIEKVGVSHVGALAVGQAVVAEINTHFPNVEIFLEQSSPILSTHAGPGAIAISYLYAD